MDGRSRIQISALIWFVYGLVMLIALPVIAGREVGSFVIMGIMMSATFLVLCSMGFVWNWGRMPLAPNAIHEAEKSKRLTRAGKILASLSENDLNMLRERLSEIDDEREDLHTLLNEDGELRRGR